MAVSTSSKEIPKGLTRSSLGIIRWSGSCCIPWWWGGGGTGGKAYRIYIPDREKKNEKYYRSFDNQEILFAVDYIFKSKEEVKAKE